MKRFLLLNAHKWQPPSPPAALDYIAWELEKAGIHSDIVDVTFLEDIEEELRCILQKRVYDGICLTIRNLDATTSFENISVPLPSIRDLVHLIREHCNCPIIAGGNGFSISPEKILDYLGADYGIWGPGEEVLHLLVQHILYEKRDLKEIAHLVYRDGDKTKKNPMLCSRKRLPAVKRGYINYRAYFRPGFENFAGFGNVETQRGCPYHCIYCVDPEIKGRTVRVKAPEDVTDEIDWFLSKGIQYFFLADSEFNADSDAAVQLLTYWMKNGYARKIKWIAYATPANFTEELAYCLSQSGNLSTMIDFAHISSPILSNLGKSYTSHTVEETISYCVKHDVPFRGSLMLGGPGETRETMKEAIEFFKGVPCKLFAVLGIRLYPNTPLGDKIRTSGPLVENPNLYGKVIDNDDLLEPVFYISNELGEDAFEYLLDLIGDSEQFYAPLKPITLSKKIYGPYRGFKPKYGISGRSYSCYITKHPKSRTRSPVYEESSENQ
jgi:radical SAM superfamily enzyme YgiQ (UPF0313 family)